MIAWGSSVYFTTFMFQTAPLCVPGLDPAALLPLLRQPQAAPLLLPLLQAASGTCSGCLSHFLQYWSDILLHYFSILARYCSMCNRPCLLLLGIGATVVLCHSTHNLTYLPFLDAATLLQLRQLLATAVQRLPPPQLPPALTSPLLPPPPPPAVSPSFSLVWTICTHNVHVVWTLSMMRPKIE